MTKHISVETHQDPGILLIGVHAPYNRTQYIDSYFEEFLNLAKSLGITKYETIFLKLREIDNRYFFTKGKLLELQEYVNAHPEVETIIISEQLSPQQERNLKDLFNKEIMDRTRLILAIFEKTAATAEGKTQVEIAKLEFEKTRLAGKGIHLAQQAGQIGVRGPGETLKERTTRVIEDNILKLKQRLKEFAQIRETQRKRRVDNQIPHVCLVGYTNAGKSTVINTLTHSHVLAEDKLFATLDTTTRQLYLDHEKIGVISDTVGFIQQLPHQLIEAFKSTLSELQYADLLLHIIDISDPNWKTHIDVVLDTLEEIGVTKEMLFVFNKADKISEEELQNRLKSFGFFAPFVVASATTKEGLADLTQYLIKWKQTYHAPE
jgi:GTP-binding protein HflX